jgi:hypothetical protein
LRIAYCELRIANRESLIARLEQIGVAMRLTDAIESPATDGRHMETSGA